jgi:hypothetical protein
VDYKPKKILIESNPKSIELSRFVWNTKDASMTLIRFLQEEAEQTETPAVAACDTLELDQIQSLLPIDLEASKTRMRLAKSLILHPIESLLLISRFHGRSIPTKALGAPEANDTENFVSLGFGGQITLKFGSPIKCVCTRTYFRNVCNTSICSGRNRKKEIQRNQCNT